MWSYRLYRYPSPSSSTLVYGISKSMADNTTTTTSAQDCPGCPQLVAQAVYRALISGLKLPPLTYSEELKQALLGFEVQALPVENDNADILNGNVRSQGGKGISEDRPRRSLTETTPGSSSSSKAVPGPSSMKEGAVLRRKTSTSSVLMLEAMSRRRMDAVRQLHEVFPQLLASIPLFDQRPSQGPGHGSDLAARGGGGGPWTVSPAVSSDFPCGLLYPQGIPLNYNRSTTTSVCRSASAASTSITLTANTCQLHFSSRLLDLASENQSLLVFVLQNHPEMDRTQFRAPFPPPRAPNSSAQAIPAAVSHIPDPTTTPNTTFQTISTVAATTAPAITTTMPSITQIIPAAATATTPNPANITTTNTQDRDVAAKAAAAGGAHEAERTEESSSSSLSAAGSQSHDQGQSQNQDQGQSQGQDQGQGQSQNQNQGQSQGQDQGQGQSQDQGQSQGQDQGQGQSQGQDVWKSREEDGSEVQRTTAAEQALVGMDPNSPISLCLTNNNLQVLQYLLFKHVWQHFLLDEVYHLPHTSLVTDALLAEILHGCPADCPWFLPCTALMGCPALLQLLLSGHYCSHSLSVLSTPETSLSLPDRGARSGVARTGPEDDPARELPSVPVSPAASQGMQTVMEDPELPDPLPGNVLKEITTELVVTDSYPEQQSQDGQKLAKANVHEERSDGVSAPCDEMSLSGLLKNDKDRPLFAFSPDVSVSAPLSPTTSDSFGEQGKSQGSGQPSLPGGGGGSSSKSKKRTVTLPEVSTSGKGITAWGSSQQSLLLSVPDPNRLYPVSLPIMDRWISRCMHVRLSALHLACWRCDTASIRILLCHGANPRLLAEELMTQDSPDNHGTPGCSSYQATDSIANSSQSSSLELSLNFVSVNASSLDLSTKSNSMEELLKRGALDTHNTGLSPLAMLALGLRSPPDFSLSIGKSLGLVQPTLPELWGGQVDRSCPQAKEMIMEALRLLLDAGSDVNASSLVFSKSYRVIELFLQPSLDLYYAPVMPRGGRDSAVLRCMDLERVAEVVLAVCWELCMRGALMGPCFSSSMEWNLYRMDWMFLQSETLQCRFLHLAVFLGLFPPLDPQRCLSSLMAGSHGRLSRSTREREGGGGGACLPLCGEQESQTSVEHTEGATDLSDPFPRPSCIPWAPSSRMSSTASPTQSTSPPDSLDGGGGTPVLLHHHHQGRPSSEDDRDRHDDPVPVRTQHQHQLEQVVTSYSSSSSPAQTLEAAPADFGADVDAGSGGGGVRGGRGGGGSSRVTDAESGRGSEGVMTPPISQAHYDVSPALTAPRSLLRSGNQSSSSPCLPTSASAAARLLHRIEMTTTGGSSAAAATTSTATNTLSASAAEAVPGPSPLTRTQRILWGLEERQRRCLDKLVTDTARLNTPTPCLELLLSYLGAGDLNLLSRLAQHARRTSNAHTEGAAQRLVHIVRMQAEGRSLQHLCRLATLHALGWRAPSVNRLPLPASLRKYLLESPVLF